MRLPTKLTIILSAILMAIVSPNSAQAHRFNTTIVLAESDLDSQIGKDFRNGFMLATTEQDGHADEESDGHLGGLDVYVTIIDRKQGMTELERIVARGEGGIVVVFGPGTIFPTVAKIVGGKNVGLLLPGQTPFSDPDMPGVAAFVANYTKSYGKKPTKIAAKGYNAARRVDVAVRIENSVDNINVLQLSFAKTVENFGWDKY